MPLAPAPSGSSMIRRVLSGRSSFGVLLVLGIILGAAPVFLGAMNHDAAWYLHAAGRMVGGERLYVDLIETNPPLILWMSVAPRLLAQALGVSEFLTLRVLVLGLILASLGLTRTALLEAWPDRPGGRRVFLVLATFALIPLPGSDFAQREHLMLALLLPYLVMAFGRATGCRPGIGLALVVGLMAGVGLALKPHFVPPWMAIEVALAARRRNWRVWFRPETLAVGGVGLAYAVAVLTLAPEYRRIILWVGPLYSASGHPPFRELCTEPATFITGLAGIGFLTLRRQAKGGDGLGLILVADFGFLAIALLQNKGFSYHFYPPMALGVLVLGLLATESADALPGPRPGIPLLMLRGALIAVVLAVGFERVNDSLVWRGNPIESATSLGKMSRMARDHAGGGSIFVFSPAVAASFPLVTYAKVGWASRHPALWFLPAFYPRGFGDAPAAPGDPVERMGATERFLLDSVVDELVTRRPTLLFIDERTGPGIFNGKRFPYLEYYSLDPRFVAFLRDYGAFARVDDFRVYRRINATPGRDR